MILFIILTLFVLLEAYSAFAIGLYIYGLSFLALHVVYSVLFLVNHGETSLMMGIVFLMIIIVVRLMHRGVGLWIGQGGNLKKLIQTRQITWTKKGK